MLAPTLPSSHINRRQAMALFVSGLGALLAAPRMLAEEPFVFGTEIDGRAVTSLAARGTRCVAAIFVATDCPISNRYLPLLSRLSHQFAPHGVRLWLV
ncbi:MAG: hypothetical protein WCB58_08960, partial [Acidobacteriaceae bacterium]